MANALDSGEELVTTIKNAAGIILAVTENPSWIEVFLEGDTMHTEIALERAKPLKDNIYKVKLAQDLIQRGLLASV